MDDLKAKELRKNGNNLLRCLVPDCGRVNAHMIGKYRLCTIHHRQHREILFLVSLVPLESKEELVVELLVNYEMIPIE